MALQFLNDGVFSGNVTLTGALSKLILGTLDTSISTQSDIMRFINSNSNDAGGFSFFTSPTAGGTVNALRILGTGAATFAGTIYASGNNSVDWSTAYQEARQWDGGNTNLTASTGRVSLGATTIGDNMFTLANPGAITFPRFNADNTISPLAAAPFRNAIGAAAYTALANYVTIATAQTISGVKTFSANNIHSDNTHVTFGPNSSWSSYLRVGGNGHTATGTEMASIATTNGNLHLDSADDASGMYLNFYAGTGGTRFGNGAAGVVATMTSAGALSMDGDLTVSGGDITLGGTGRIQGVDTVSANTDAANKLYVDNAVAGVPIGDYVTLGTQQTITADKTFNASVLFNLTTFWRVSSTDAALQRADARDDATSYARLHWYGQDASNATSNFRHAYYDGANYINVTAASGRLSFGGKVAGSTPTAAGDFATKAYADGLTPGAGVFLPLAGGTLTGALTGTSATFSTTVTATGGFLVPYAAATKKPMINLVGATNYGLWHTEGSDDIFSFDFGGVSKQQFFESGNAIFAGTITGQNIYGNQFVDAQDNAYYANPAMTSVMKGASFDGDVTVTTQAVGNNSTLVATTAYVDVTASQRTPLNDIRSLGAPAFTNGANPNITTAQVMAEIEGDGGFDSYSSVFKTSWSYAGNYNLTDAGDFTETAGSSWLTWTDNSSDTTRGNITTLAIAPNSGGSAGGVFIYNDQGASYSPGWRQVWTSTTDGAGSGLDADKLDGQEGSYYATAASLGNYLPIANPTFTGTLTGPAATITTVTGALAGNASTATLAANSTLAGGLAINTSGTNNVANQIVRTEANGYVNFGWINSASGATTSTITRITASNDAYLRYVTPATFRSQVIAPYFAPIVTGGYLPVANPTFTGTLTGPTAVINSTTSNDYRSNSNWYGTSSGFWDFRVMAGASSKMRILANGNVGIGTTSPRAALQVAKGISAAVPTPGDNTACAVFGNSTSDNNYGLVLGALGSGTSYISSQRTNGASTTYNLAIQPNGGNVGIGTTSPGAKLDIVGDGTSYALEVNNSSTGDGIKINTEENLSNNGILWFQGSKQMFNLYSDSSNNAQMILRANGAYKIYLNSSGISYINGGNVGIGTTNPSEKLEVDGKVKSNGIKLMSGTTEYLNTSSYSNNAYLYGYASGSTIYFGQPATWTQNIRVNGTATATNFILSSDKTLKNKIKEIDTNHIDVNWKNFELKSEPGVKRAGVIAQELEEKHPEFVRTDDEGIKSVAYIDLLITKIAELEARLEKAGI
mgnify:CR=1 FL=1